MVEKPIFAEIEFVEDQVHQQIKDWSDTRSVRAGIFWAVRRVDPALLSWEQLGQFDSDDFQIVDEGDGADAVPPAPSPSGSPATADDSSETSEPTTSPTSPAI